MSNIAPQHLPRKLLAWLSAHVLSLQLAEGGVISSHREAMMKTQHTCCSQFAVRYILQLIMQMKVKPPHQQIMV